ncbi:MAG TPA: MgtC/SapB family protein [Chryseolinea sp.]
MDRLNDFLSPYLLSVIVSTGIGLIIGLEREFRKTNEKDHFAGIRTFPLVSLSGCAITYIGETTSMWLAVGGLVAFMILVATTYVVRSSKGHSGITTEISLIITFVLGMMASQQLIKEALAIMVITTTLLTLKGKFHSFVLKITEEELFAFLKFIILCLLLFPFLPDTDYGPEGILNPREIGLIVVIVSSLSLITYLLIKFAGTNKGILFTAFLGGLFSSTAVTWMLASRSGKTEIAHAPLHAAGIIIASSIMFIRVVVVASIFNRDFFGALLLPCALMFLSGSLYAFLLIKKEKTPDNHSAPVELGNPLNILNALGFGVLYIGTALLVYYADKLLGDQGLILSGLITGLVDIDAITINIAKLADKTLDLKLAVTVIVLATITNTFVKMMIAITQGNAVVRRKVSLALGTMMLIGICFAALRLL